MQIEVKDINGKEIKKVDLPDEVFSVEMNEHVLHTAVKAIRANLRQGTHATKTRSMVRGGGKKPFRQKGTGNARQGSTRSPHMSNGATAHGPQPRDYTQKTNKKMRKLALKVALSDKVRHGKLVVVDDFSISTYTTKHVLNVMSTFGSSSALLSDERKDDYLFRSTRNLQHASCVRPAEMNVMDVLRYDSLVLSEMALDSLKQRLV